MLPPYETEEVANAVAARLHVRHLDVQAVSVSGNDLTRTWRIAARLVDGREVVADYPYADALGIHTPGELADWFGERAASWSAT